MIKLQMKLNDELMCSLCPNFCVLGEGETGECGVRTCRDGKIELDTYGIVSAMAVEPIEKKPFTDFLPGTKTLSFGGFGCSYSCHFCENNKISQEKTLKGNFYSPEKIIQLAKQYNCASICATYNEPTISYEFLMDIAEEVHLNGLKFIIKTNGYVNKKPWKSICDVVDAMNLDFKGNADSYLSVAGAKHYVILDRIKEAYENGVHIEISIPLHDQMRDEHLEEFGQFISDISSDIPCHLLKIQSAYKHSNTTSDDRIVVAKNILEKYSSTISVH